MRGVRIGAVLVGAVLVGLGCAGVLPEELQEFLPAEADAVPEAPGTVPPDPPTEADEGGADDGSAEDESDDGAEAPAVEASVDARVFRVTNVTPPPSAELIEDSADRAMLIHRDAWNVEAIWRTWVIALTDGGWVRYRSHEPPPFEGLFQQPGRVIDLRLKQAGPTVTVTYEVKSGNL